MSGVQRGKPSQVNNGKNRRKPNKRKNNRWNNYANAGRQLVADVAALRSLINVEEKYIDTIQTITLSGAWQLQLLNGVTTGTSSVTRTGQSIKLTGWEFKTFLTINVTNTSPQSVRIIVFLDKQANATAPTATDVYPAFATSFRVVGSIERFQILYERWEVLTPSNVSGLIDSLSRKMSLHVYFNTGTAGTIADIVSNSIYVMAFSDAGANYPTLITNSRITFVDN